MDNQRGMGLIELMVFILVIGVAVSAVMACMIQVLSGLSAPGKMAQASFLATARMEIILLQRAVNGNSVITDPCLTALPGICTSLSDFAFANGYTVKTNAYAIVYVSERARKITIRVQVSGASRATEVTQVSDYQ